MLNDLLRTQEVFIETYFNESPLRSSGASLSDLKEKFNRRFKFPESRLSDEFFAMYDTYLDEKANEKGWKKETKKMYDRLRKKIHEFKSNIKFSDLSRATMDALKIHLSKTMYNDALSKNLQYFKSFVKWAEQKGMKVHEEFATYSPKLPKAKKVVRALSLDDLEVLYNMSFDKDDGQERAGEHRSGRNGGKAYVRTCRARRNIRDQS